jgi:dimethylhistidine N-methyltransferase
MQPFAASPTPGHASERFASAVAESLSATPRRLPSEFFYDALGSALFDAICALPWYPITRAETTLLGAHGREIAARAGTLATVVELGPGSGRKLALLLPTLAGDRPLDVHLVDVSPDALDTASHALSRFPNLRVTAHLAPYEEGAAAALDARPPDGRSLTLFLGSNIGNFDRAGADAFLRGLRSAHRRGDYLLLGTDLVKPAAEMLLAYDDPLGVTAAFNLNLLVRANRELGANFAIEAFSHRAVWNEHQSRVEMHLVSVKKQRVRLPAARLDIVFEAGDAIWTESSHKFEPAGVGEMLARAGFRPAAQWVESGFALTLGEAV